MFDNNSSKGEMFNCMHHQMGYDADRKLRELMFMFDNNPSMDKIMLMLHDTDRMFNYSQSNCDADRMLGELMLMFDNKITPRKDDIVVMLTLMLRLHEADRMFNYSPSKCDADRILANLMFMFDNDFSMGEIMLMLLLMLRKDDNKSTRINNTGRLDESPFPEAMSETLNTQGARGEHMLKCGMSSKCSVLDESPFIGVAAMG